MRLELQQIWVSPLLQESGDRRKVLGKEKHVAPWWKLLLGHTGTQVHSRIRHPVSVHSSSPQVVGLGLCPWVHLVRVRR